MPTDRQKEEPTAQEIAVAQNLKTGLIVALVASLALFVAETLIL
jgi:hypothetical protein